MDYDTILVISIIIIIIVLLLVIIIIIITLIILRQSWASLDGGSASTLFCFGFQQSPLAPTLWSKPSSY